MAFGVDFKGRLRKIRAPASASLQALFEAVANSFDATEHLGSDARVTVRILRAEDKSLFPSQQKEWLFRF